MIWFHRWKYLFVCVAIILAIFMITGLLHLLLVFVTQRIYDDIVYDISFGIAGVLAAIMGYKQSVGLSKEPEVNTRRSLVLLIIATGLGLFLYLWLVRGADYGTPFKIFGLTLALTAIFFMKRKIHE